MKNWRRKAALLLATSMVFSVNWQSSVPAQEMPETAEEFLTEDAAVSADYESAEELFAADVVSDGSDETDISADAADLQETMPDEAAGLIDDGNLSAEDTVTVPGAAAVEMADAADLIEDEEDLIPMEDSVADAESASERAEPEAEDEFAEPAEDVPDFTEEVTDFTEEVFPETTEGFLDEEDELPDTAGVFPDEEDELPETETKVTGASDEIAGKEEIVQTEPASGGLSTEEEMTEEARESVSELAAPEVGVLDPFINITQGATILPGHKLGADKKASLKAYFELDDALAAGIPDFTDKSAVENIKWVYIDKSTGTSTSYSPLTPSINCYLPASIEQLAGYMGKKSFQIIVKYKKGSETIEYKSSIFDYVWGGKCGTDAYWEFQPVTNTLSVSGIGATYNLINEANASWYAFKDEIKKVTVAEGITALGGRSFYKYDNLEQVSLADTVYRIGNSCFPFSSKLTTINGGDGVTEIDANAFNSCTALTELSFPNVEKINYWAFRNCTKIENLYLLSKKLKEINLCTDSAHKDEGPFQLDPQMTVHVYAGTRVSEYYREDTWKTQGAVKIGIRIDTAEVSGITDKIYTGTPITQQPVIKDNAYTLLESTDYKITYTDNTASGTATMKIEGIGDYEGSLPDYTFKISPMDLSSATVEGAADQTYNGTALTPALTVKAGAAVLAADKDYTAAYKDNTNTGTATVTVTGIGNYTGTVTKTFKITSLDLSTATVDDLEDQIYNGTALTPAPTVKTGEVTLTADKDYTVTYQNNTDPGTATVTITGKDNCTGTVTKTFLIKEREKVPSPLPADEASIENPLVVKDVETTIAGMKTDEDIKGSSFNLLQLKAVARTSSIKLSWKKVAGAKEYVIYGNKCGKKNRYKKITTVTGKQLVLKKVHGKNLKKGTYYKFLVMAVSDQDVLAVSKTIHIAHKGGRYGNAVKVTLDKTKINLKKKKKAIITPYVRVGSLTVKNHRAVAFESSDIRIATVTKKGRIKAKAKGTCYVYAYAQNGKFAKVKVVVK